MSSSFSANCGSLETLKGPAQVRLKSVLLPDASDRRRAEVCRASHDPAAPVRGSLRLALRRPTHHHRHDLRRIGRLAPATRRIFLKTCPTLRNKASAPSGRFLLGDPQLPWQFADWTYHLRQATRCAPVARVEPGPPSCGSASPAIACLQWFNSTFGAVRISLLLPHPS